MSELHAVAHKMVEKNKGILAADELSLIHI